MKAVALVNRKENIVKSRGVVFVAWKKLSLRSKLISKALGASLLFFPDRAPYIRAAIKTFVELRHLKHSVVIIQLPQGPLLLEALLIKKFLKCKVVADVHTGFLVADNWKGCVLNKPFAKFLRMADLILVHNENILELLPNNAKVKALIVYDPWHLIKTFSKHAREPYIVLPASFSPDEPIEEIITSIKSSDLNVKIYVTGDWRRQPKLKKYASSNIIFTDFLPYEEYNKLLSGAAGIITGTKREYTVLNSAWEAVAYLKPLALTETVTLKPIFRDYAVFFNWRNSKSIVEAVKKILTLKPNFVAYQKLRLLTLSGLRLLNEELEKLKSG
jgi:hypothetical protein